MPPPPDLERLRLTVATPRLTLEPLRVDHAAEMVDVLADPELYRHTGGQPASAAELTERYRAQVAGPGRAGEVWCNWVVRRSDSGAAVGYVQATLVRRDEGWVAEVAWVIGTAFQRQGLATEAAGAMVDHLDRCGVRSFVAHVGAANVASGAVATRLGFVPTGETSADGERRYVRP